MQEHKLPEAFHITKFQSCGAIEHLLHWSFKPRKASKRCLEKVVPFPLQVARRQTLYQDANPVAKVTG